MRNNKGQTALILILLAAAALIFYAATLNWGHIAQEKTMLTLAADEAAASLGSSVASYGETQKVQYLQNRNKHDYTDLKTVIFVIVGEVAIALSLIFSGGSTAGVVIAAIIAVSSTTAAVLQPTVLQPMQDSMWNKLQQALASHPEEQVLESAIGQALQMSTSDPVSLTDYFDSNANGIFGLTSATAGVPAAKDTVPRFAFFYTERLKMLAGIIINVDPQVKAFEDAVRTANNYLNDAQSSTTPGTNPYNNPCCQPYFVESGGSQPYVNKWPQGCPTFTTTACTSLTANAGELEPASGCDICACSATNPPYNMGCNPYGVGCAADFGIPDPMHGGVACEGASNPYGPQYPFLYDALYQKSYPAGTWPSLNSTSLPSPYYVLEQWGRDLQLYSSTPNTVSNPNPAPPLAAPSTADPYAPFAPSAKPTQTPLALRTIAGFPDGIYPFFWYSQYNAANPPGTIPTNSITYTTDAEGSYNNSTALGTNSDAFNWSAGDNEMCSPIYPYNQPTAGAYCNAKLDPLDSVRYILQYLVRLANDISQNSASYTSANLVQWYQQIVAPLMAPKCTDSGVTSLTSVSGANPIRDACNPNSDGALLSIWNPYATYPNSALPIDLMYNWQQELINWLQHPFTTSPNAWCFPSGGSASVIAGSPEDKYINGQTNDSNLNTIISTINATSSPASALTILPLPGSYSHDLGDVLACLDYHASISAADANDSAASASLVNCYNALLNTFQGTNPSGCPASGNNNLPQACQNLDRSLVAGQSSWDGQCSSTCNVSSGWTTNGGTGCNSDPTSTTYMGWLNNSILAANNAAPYFAERSTFLKQLYNEAAIMLQVFSQTRTSLQGLLGTTKDNYQNFPLYQLMVAYQSLINSSKLSIPNSIIYGWQDPTPLSGNGCRDQNNNIRGCGHIVKVTAYAAGRPPKNQTLPCDVGANEQENSSGTAKCIAEKLPRVYSHVDNFTDKNDLVDRDGWVFVKVKRWDESHTTPTYFPNNLPLWTFSTGTSVPGFPTWDSIISNCVSGKGYGSSAQTNNGPIGPGYGLSSQMYQALQYYYPKFQVGKITQTDQMALDQAFMLNDSGNGSLDPNVTANYNTCLQNADLLLSTGISSEACVAYIATDNGASISQNMSSPDTADNSANYTILYEPCPNDLPDDL